MFSPKTPRLRLISDSGWNYFMLHNDRNTRQGLRRSPGDRRHAEP